MRNYTIIVPSDIAESTVVDDIANYLTEFGLMFNGGKNTNNGRYIFSFKANLSRTKINMLNTLIMHVADKLNKPEWYVSIASTSLDFDFEYYQNTDLDGPSIEGDIQELLLAFSQIIDNVLVDATTEYKRQARKEIVRLLKENADQWIDLGENLGA